MQLIGNYQLPICQDLDYKVLISPLTTSSHPMGNLPKELPYTLEIFRQALFI
jgi:hypothetical protein